MLVTILITFFKVVFFSGYTIIHEKVYVDYNIFLLSSELCKFQCYLSSIVLRLVDYSTTGSHLPSSIRVRAVVYSCLFRMSLLSSIHLFLGPDDTISLKLCYISYLEYVTISLIYCYLLVI